MDIAETLRAETLRLHALWAKGEAGGVKADLSDADLRRADLREAILRGVDLRGAIIHRADLSGAILRGSDLSGATGLPDPRKWVDACEKHAAGIIAYKQFGLHYASPSAWRIEAGAEIAEVVNPDRGTECGSGVNVAHRDWRGFDKSKPIWRVLIKWRDLATLVVPFGTDGKARVGAVTLLEVVDA